MRIAIFGDIHANLEALQVVLADASSQQCTDYICLGDIVGYNPNPVECIDIVRGMNCPVVKGNHDYDASLDHSLETMNPVAAEAMRWTRSQIDEERREWLRKLRMVRQVADFTVVHSTLDQPARWDYVTNRYDAMSNFAYQFTQVCFHGHTHVPRVYMKGSVVQEVAAETVIIEPGMKYFINAGSVGQPRDGDWRACYAVYDTDEKRISFRRLEYDVAETGRKIIAAGLPESLASRLLHGS